MCGIWEVGQRETERDRAREEKIKQKAIDKQTHHFKTDCCWKRGGEIRGTKQGEKNTTFSAQQPGRQVHCCVRTGVVLVFQPTFVRERERHNPYVDIKKIHQAQARPVPDKPPLHLHLLPAGKGASYLEQQQESDEGAFYSSRCAGVRPDDRHQQQRLPGPGALLQIHGGIESSSGGAVFPLALGCGTSQVRVCVCVLLCVSVGKHGVGKRRRR